MGGMSFFKLFFYYYFFLIHEAFWLLSSHQLPRASTWLPRTRGKQHTLGAAVEGGGGGAAMAEEGDGYVCVPWDVQV